MNNRARFAKWQDRQVVPSRRQPLYARIPVPGDAQPPGSPLWPNVAHRPECAEQPRLFRTPSTLIAEQETLTVDRPEAISVFDEIPPWSITHATSAVAVMGEDLAAAALQHCLERNGASNVTVRPETVGTGGRRGPRLDRWIEVDWDSKPQRILFQTEIKNLSAHSTGAKTPPRRVQVSPPTISAAPTPVPLCMRDPPTPAKPWPSGITQVVQHPSAAFVNGQHKCPSMKNVTFNQKKQASLKVLNGRLAEQMTVDQAAELMGVSPRHTRRIMAAYREKGAAALAHGHRGRRPPNATSETTRAEVLHLTSTRYSGANHTHLSELLGEREGIDIDRSTLRRILVSAGLNSPCRRRPPQHRVRRQRMPQEGMLVQMDGSYHRWLGEAGPQFTLLLAVDDATGAVVNALFCEREERTQLFPADAGVGAELRRPGCPLRRPARRFQAHARVWARRCSRPSSAAPWTSWGSR